MVSSPGCRPGPGRHLVRLATVQNQIRAWVARSGNLLHALIGLIYAGLRYYHFHTVEQVAEFYDTLDYMRVALWSLGDGRFWSGIKPPVIPLWFKLFNGNLGLIAWGQLLFSICAWLALAVVLARAMRSKGLQIAALIGVLGFSLNADILMWDTVLLSESLALSLTALLIAGWLALTRKWTGLRAVLLCLVAVLWTFTRDVHAWLLLPMAALIGAASFIRPAQRRGLFIAAVLVIAFVVNSASAGRGEGIDKRWVLPLINVITQRVLPNPAMLAWFEQQGMPVSPALLRLSGSLGWENNWAAFDDYALQPFRDWLTASGKSVYLRYLLAHPLWLLGEPLRHLDDILTPSNLHIYPSPTFKPLLPPLLTGFLSLGRNAWFLGWAAAAAMIAVTVAAVWKRSRPDSRWLIVALVIALAYPHALIVWHGDAAEVGRHSITVNMQLRLGLWMLIWLAADEVWTRSGRRMTLPAWSVQHRSGIAYGVAALIGVGVLMAGYALGREFVLRRTAGGEMEAAYRAISRLPQDELVYIPRPEPLPGSLLFGLGNTPSGRVKSFCSGQGSLPIGVAAGATFLIHPAETRTLADLQNRLPHGQVDRRSPFLTVLRISSGQPIPGHLLRANWSDQVSLLGFDLSAQAVAPGQTIQITVYWQARRKMDRPWTFFVHLVGEQINPDTASLLWGQHDAQPAAATYPTTFWSPGEMVIGEYAVPVSPHAPPGQYELRAGWYFLPTLERLPATDEQGQLTGDHVVLAEIQLVNGR